MGGWFGVFGAVAERAGSLQACGWSSLASVRTVRRVLLVLLIATGTGFVLPLFGTSALPLDCGKTTLEGTLVDSNSDGVLDCGPGQGVVLRQDLGSAQAGREKRRKTMKTFVAFADFQLADEESPARGEWADGCGGAGIPGGLRPHESMVPHMMNAHVRAANRISKSGSPILKRPFDFAVALGDLADNKQFNETRWFIDILDGKKLLNPDSGQSQNPEVDASTDDYAGPDDYDGVMTGDPPSGDPLDDDPLAVPDQAVLPAGMPRTLNNLANEPFWLEGLRRPDGKPLPWHTVMGNHDVKVQGSVPDDNPAWRALVGQYVVGHNKIPADSSAVAAFCADPTPENFANILLNTNGNLVPADANRRFLNKIDWINEHFTTSGSPVGHGFLANKSNWCPAGPPPTGLSADGSEPHRRGCYSWIEDPFHFITLDSNPLEGLESGNIDDMQFNWLEELLKSSSKVYFETDGTKVTNATGKDRLIVIFAHHPLGSQDNPGHPFDGGPSVTPVHDGDDLKALLLRFPNVILLADGHSHQNRIWPHEDTAKGTGFWEVNTSAIADFPTHSRTFELADNRDGTISIFSVVFDARGAADARDIAWVLDDPTDETTLADAAKKINEEWLASAGREILHNDLQQDQGALGAAEDRNVELIVETPFRICNSSRCDPK